MAHTAAASPVTFATVRRLALAFPGVEEGTAYGTPALRVRAKFLARLLDGDTLVLRCTPEHRAALVEADPVTFFVTAHYEAHPYVLVRLSTTTEEEMRTLLEAAWRDQAPAKVVRGWAA